MQKQNLTPLENKLGHQFNSKDILQQSLVHRSYLNEHKNFPLDHNERLEFLGDAVLELIVTDHLYRNYNLPEGELTNLRSAVVRGEMLSRVAHEIGLENFLLLSRGEQQGTEKARNYILANAVEAVIGALYLDQGYEGAKDFISRTIVQKLPEIVEKGMHIDAKSKFQELAQEKYKVTPTYEVIKEEGLDHDKEFFIGVFLGDKKFATGKGGSKQEAQQDAARKALEEITEKK